MEAKTHKNDQKKRDFASTLCKYSLKSWQKSEYRKSWFLKKLPVKIIKKEPRKDLKASQTCENKFQATSKQQLS